MDNKESKPFLGGLLGNPMLAAVLVAAGALALREVPLEGTRPAANEPRIEQRFAQQDIDARLWQDPFGAVARAREDLPKKLGAERAKVEELRHGDKQLAEELARKASEGVTDVVVLGVMLAGGPYAEYVESRRRTRYAVLAGLNAGNYAPLDTEHIGYFIPSKNTDLPHVLPESVPYEWFEPAVSSRASDPVTRRVLVMWIDGDAFYQQPLKRFERLLRPFLTVAGAPRLQMRILGPTGSDGLRAMVDEVRGKDFNSYLFSEQDIRFYSPGATVADATLLESLGSRNTDSDLVALAAKSGTKLTVSDVMAMQGVRMQRTIGSDRALAKALTEELVLRGLAVQPVPALDSAIKPEPTSPADIAARNERYRKICAVGEQGVLPPSQIALVAEWDTLYGRSLRREFMIEADDNKGFCVNRYNYVRGLDGLLPERGSAAPADGAAAKSGAKDDNRRSDGSFIERAEGQSQFDYLRRLAARLRERDLELRARNGASGGIRAIGVLGNDVHDKLLVLQALQPDFPNAIFFTTDLDARLLHPREQEWARNLIVASSFGLRLDDKLQVGTPPLRDSYQTSVYFTTRLVLSELKDGTGEFITQARIDGWLSHPRLFEVGRSMAFDYSPAASTAADANTSWQCRRGKLALCADIHPPPSQLYPKLSLPVVGVMASLLVLLLWLPVLRLSRMLRRRLRRFVARGGGEAGRWTRRLLLVALLLVLQVVLPWQVAGLWEPFAIWLTRDGKPINMAEGISIWPSEGIHLLTFLLCLYLVFRGWTALSSNLDKISLALRMGKTRRQLEAEQGVQDASLSWWQRLANVYSLEPLYVGRLPAAAASDPAMTAATLATWKFYITQNRTQARFARSLLGSLVAVVLAYLLRQTFGEPSGAPQRGQISAELHHGLAMAAVVVMIFLVFYVADATLFSVRYLRELRHHTTTWPQRTIRYFESRIGVLPPRLLDHWIDLQFISQRTACVSGLIYYPFIVLSLLLLSRSTYFDDWRLPTAVMLMASLCVLLVLGCVVALRLSAERSRRQALIDVRDALLRANDRTATGTASTGQLDLLRRQIEDLHEGALAPFSQQPLLKAVLLPFATLGGTNLLDILSMAKI